MATRVPHAVQLERGAINIKIGGTVRKGEGRERRWEEERERGGRVGCG